VVVGNSANVAVTSSVLQSGPGGAGSAGGHGGQGAGGGSGAYGSSNCGSSAVGCYANGCCGFLCNTTAYSCNYATYCASGGYPGGYGGHGGAGSGGGGGAGGPSYGLVTVGGAVANVDAATMLLPSSGGAAGDSRAPAGSAAPSYVGP
jgi:hypothetical protein